MSEMTKLDLKKIIIEERIAATGAIGRLQARLEESEARVKALEEALRESILQIEYMHRIFQETGTGNAVLTRLKALEATCQNTPKE